MENDTGRSCIRFLVITPFFWPMGEGKGMPALFRIYSRLSELGHRIQVVLPPFNVFDPSVENRGAGGSKGVEIVRFFFPRALMVSLEQLQESAGRARPAGRVVAGLKVALWILGFSVFGLWKAAQVAKASRPDIIIGHTYLGMFPAYALSRALGIPSVARIHGTNESGFVQHPSMRALLRSPELFSLRIPIDLFVIDDDGTAGDQVARAAGIPESRIALIPNAVDRENLMKPYDQAGIRGALSIQADAIVVVAISRLVSWKRVDRIITAMSNVTHEREVVCLIVGDGPEMTKLLTEADSLGEGDRVKFVGAVRHGDVGKYLAVADIFVSTNDLTNLCIPLLEAMTCGKCVVTINNGGTSRLIENWRTGILLEPTALNQLPAVINQLIENPDLRRSLAKNAMAFARDNVLNWDERAMRELALYSRLSSGGARG